MYPTLEEVEQADRVQICRWYRFLSSPGVGRIGEDDFEKALEREKKVMDRIVERSHELGGFTPAISKQIGLD